MVLNCLVNFSLGYATLWLILRKRSEIVHFLSSDPASVPKLRKIDLLCLFLHSTLTFIFILPTVTYPNVLEAREKLFAPFLIFSPPLKRIVLFILLLLDISWFQLTPFCIVLYTLGYYNLYAFKLTVLTDILNTKDPINCHYITHKLKCVSIKQHKFESIFGPFLFLVLCYNSLASIHFFYALKKVTTDHSPQFYYFLAYSLFIQVMCISMILFVSCYNEKLKDLSTFVLDQLESKLLKTSIVDYSMVNWLYKKINAINQPLTVCKMMNIDRQIVLAIATSCFSFSALYIQMNNATLTSNSS